MEEITPNRRASDARRGKLRKGMYILLRCLPPPILPSASMPFLKLCMALRAKPCISTSPPEPSDFPF